MMTQEEVETVVLETVRRYAPNGKASEDTRIEKDLRLTELARQRLFASLVEAFNARGTNLPSRGYFLSNFNACPTVADVQQAINNALFTKAAPKGKHGHGHAAHAPKPAPAPEPEEVRTPEPALATPVAETTPAPDAQPDQAVGGALTEAEAPKKATRKRSPAKKKPAKKKSKRKTAPKRKPRAAMTEADGVETPTADPSAQSSGEPATPAAPQDAPPAGPAVAA